MTAMAYVVYSPTNTRAPTHKNIGPSDHRPVVMALDLVVDRMVTRGFRVSPSLPPPSMGGADATRFTITLACPMLHLRPNAQGFSFLREPEEVVVSFPLWAEDPWAAERKASTLEQVRRVRVWLVG